MAHVKSKGLERILEDDAAGINPADCEDPECRNPLNILPRILSATLNGQLKEEQKEKIVKAAKLDAWRINNCPLDKETLGRGTWGLLHNMAIKFPDHPTKDQQQKMTGLMEGVAMFFPCKICSKDFTKAIKESPPL